MSALLLFSARQLLVESPLPSPPPIHSISNTSSSSDPYNSAYGINTRFNPSMAIIIVVLLSAFFFMGFFSVYIRRCTTDDDRFPHNNSRPPEGRGRPSHGLDKDLVDTFPVVTYSAAKGLKGGKETECVVCLSEFEENDALRLLPKCRHAFHQDCIDMWLFSHTTCPLCRRSLLPDKVSSFRDLFSFGSSNRAARENSPTADEHDITASQAFGQDVPCSGSNGRRVIFSVDNTDDRMREIERRPLAQCRSDAVISHQGSPIYGLRYPSHRSNSRSGGSGGLKFSRSNSTGHSGIKAQAPTVSSEEENHQSFTFRLPLLASDFHRSRSLTTFTPWVQQEQDKASNERGAEPTQGKEEVKGWTNFSFRSPFNMKGDAETRLSIIRCTGETSSSMPQEDMQPALSSVASMRKTLMRFAGIEKKPDLISCQSISAQGGEFHQLSRML